MIALEPGKTVDYVCKCDRALPKTQQTVWKVRYPTMREEAYIMDDSTKFKRSASDKSELEFTMSSVEQAYKALSVCLMGCDNFRDSKGNEVKLKRDEAATCIMGNIKPWREVDIQRIRRKERDEIAAYIINGGEIMESELKNL